MNKWERNLKLKNLNDIAQLELVLAQLIDIGLAMTDMYLLRPATGAIPQDIRNKAQSLETPLLVTIR